MSIEILAVSKALSLMVNNNTADSMLLLMKFKHHCITMPYSLLTQINNNYSFGFSNTVILFAYLS